MKTGSCFLAVILLFSTALINNTRCLIEGDSREVPRGAPGTLEFKSINIYSKKINSWRRNNRRALEESRVPELDRARIDASLVKNSSALERQRGTERRTVGIEEAYLAERKSNRASRNSRSHQTRFFQGRNRVGRVRKTATDRNRAERSRELRTKNQNLAGSVAQGLKNIRAQVKRLHEQNRPRQVQTSERVRYEKFDAERNEPLLRPIREKNTGNADRNMGAVGSNEAKNANIHSEQTNTKSNRMVRNQATSSQLKGYLHVRDGTTQATNAASGIRQRGQNKDKRQVENRSQQLYNSQKVVQNSGKKRVKDEPTSSRILQADTERALRIARNYPGTVLSDFRQIVQKKEKRMRTESRRMIRNQAERMRSDSRRMAQNNAKRAPSESHRMLQNDSGKMRSDFRRMAQNDAERARSESYRMLQNDSGKMRSDFRRMVRNGAEQKRSEYSKMDRNKAERMRSDSRRIVQRISEPTQPKSRQMVQTDSGKIRLDSRRMVRNGAEPMRSDSRRMAQRNINRSRCHLHRMVWDVAERVESNSRRMVREEGNFEGTSNMVRKNSERIKSKLKQNVRREVEQARLTHPTVREPIQQARKTVRRFLLEDRRLVHFDSTRRVDDTDFVLVDQERVRSLPLRTVKHDADQVLQQFHGVKRITSIRTSPAEEKPIQFRSIVAFDKEQKKLDANILELLTLKPRRARMEFDIPTYQSNHNENIYSIKNMFRKTEPEFWRSFTSALFGGTAVLIMYNSHSRMGKVQQAF